MIAAERRSWRPTVLLARALDITQGQAATAIITVTIAVVLTFAGLPPVLRNRDSGSERAAPAAATTPTQTSSPEAGETPAAPAVPVLGAGGYAMSSSDSSTSFVGSPDPVTRESSPSPPATGEVSRFASIDTPGAPDGIAVDADGTVYVATDNNVGPSKIFALDQRGTVIRSFTITGQPDGHERGLTGVALDGRGGLLALDGAAGRVLRVDLRSGDQSTVADLVNLPACGLVVAAPSGCEPGVADDEPLPRGVAFDRGGTLYVTDAAQGVLWRIPAGGKPEAWLTSRSFGSGNGLAGVAIDAAGSILVATPRALDPAAPLGGAVYRVSTGADGKPGEPALVAAFPVGEEPAGVAALSDGSFVVALRGAGVVALIGADGTETRRVAGLQTPTGVAFAGDALLVTDQTPATVMKVGIR